MYTCNQIRAQADCQTKLASVASHHSLEPSGTKSGSKLNAKQNWDLLLLTTAWNQVEPSGTKSGTKLIAEQNWDLLLVTASWNQVEPSPEPS